METNLEIYNKVRVVPKEAQKEIQAGRLRGFTDINPMWRIKMLTELFGVCGFGWYTKIIEQKIEIGSDGQKVAFIQIHLFVKQGNEWSMPIEGIGGSSFIANEKNGAYTSDEALKMAYTDAISIACKSLGFGADIYFSKDKSKYDVETNAPIKSKMPEPIPAPKRDDRLPIALQCVKEAASLAALETVWKGWECFWGDETFKTAVKSKKETFKN